MERCSIKRNTLKGLVLREFLNLIRSASSYNLCVCATLIAIRAPGFEDCLQEKL